MVLSVKKVNEKLFFSFPHELPKLCPHKDMATTLEGVIMWAFTLITAN